MNIAPLVRARRAMVAKPSWTSLFLKGYALLAWETPELRRAYIKFPWPRLYEYPESVASVAHERVYQGERAVLLTRIKGPERRSVAELAELIQAARSRPILEVEEFRRALKMARAPCIVRRLLMWLALNIGRQRPNYFGTFQLSVYSALGSESFTPLTPLTTLLNYGPISEAGLVNVRVIYDHRVIDGATVARALLRLEQILNDAVVAELKEPAKGAAVVS